jgi:hypothetical protein
MMDWLHRFTSFLCGVYLAELSGEGFLPRPPYHCSGSLRGVNVNDPRLV